MIRALWIDDSGKVDCNYGLPYSSVAEFFMLEGKKQGTYFMAHTKLQFSHLIDYCRRYNAKCVIKASDGTNIYSLSIGPLNFRSIDFIFNKPFTRVRKEFGLAEKAAGVAQLVDIIEEAGQPFSFINKEYLTISKLAILQLQVFAPKEYLNYRYPIMAERDYEFCKKNRIYRGGINCLNETFQDREVSNLYKYDKNSYFAYVMKYGNMPIGHKYHKQGQPPTDKDVLVHVKLSGTARFKGVYPYKDFKGDRLETMLAYDDWLWIDELEAYKKYYEFFDIEYIEYYEWLWNKPEPQFGKFVDEYYEKKRTETGVKRYFVKRILNGAYGKLGQSPIRSNFKIDENGTLKQTKKTFISFGDKYNIYVASKITALARAWLLNDIYAATDGRPDLYFVYCDTDSIMMTRPMTNTCDALGAYKDEGPQPGKPWLKAKFLGCKCYILYDGQNYECHAAGINQEALMRKISGLEWTAAMEQFSYGKEFDIPTMITVDGIKYVVLAPRILKNLDKFETYDAKWNATYGVYETKEN